MQLRAVTDRISIADQPTAEEFAELKRWGFVAVVNLRNDGEPEQPLSTAEEGRVVRALGLEYLHHGIGGAPLTLEGIEQACDFVDRHAAAGKVLLHCRKGGRAAALALIQQARAHGWKPHEALAHCEARGLKLEGNLRLLVEQFLASNP